ncbi:MAG TPA: NADPH:quinone oxidoreductase family protein, partial [Dehalococcoidia bacterium]|nr:NADPH:quinone oxidoreductase family protein [Dehalococcoidia bacterium]
CNAIEIPDDMSYETAATIPIAYGTSYLALTQRARLQQGEVVLVHGASGGVGLTAVEISHALGATVIATASSHEKLLIAKSYGADVLINYAQ